MSGILVSRGGVISSSGGGTPSNDLLSGLAFYNKMLSGASAVGPNLTPSAEISYGSGPVTGEGAAIADNPGASLSLTGGSLVLGDPCTLFLRVRLNDLSQFTSILTAIDADSNTFLVSWDASGQKFIVGPAVALFDLVPVSPQAGDWFTIVLTINGDTTAGKLNDSVTGSSIAGGALVPWTLPTVTLGQANSTGSVDLAAVGIWGASLSSGNQTALHNGGVTLKYADLGAGLLANLQHWYDFAETALNSRVDAVGDLDFAASIQVVRVVADTGFAARLHASFGSLSAAANAAFGLGDQDWLLMAWVRNGNPLTGYQSITVGEQTNDGFDLTMTHSSVSFETPGDDGNYDAYLDGFGAEVNDSSFHCLLAWYSAGTVYLQVDDNAPLTVADNAEPTPAVNALDALLSAPLAAFGPMGLWKGTIPDADGRALLVAATPYASFN